MKINPVANFINNSKPAQNVLKHIDKNPAVYSAVTSFILAGIMRPTLIGCFNFRDEKDKKYSQASAVAAGVVELAATAAIFMPLNKSIQKSSDILYNSSNEIFRHNADALKRYKSVTNRGIKVLSLIPISLLRFSLVKPIVDFCFGDKNDKGMNKAKSAMKSVLKENKKLDVQG